MSRASSSHGSADSGLSEALLERWQEQGDIDALDALLRQEITALKAAIRHRAAGMLSASLAASDAASEALLRLVRQEEPPRFDSPAAMRAYLWRTAWRLLVDRMRARRGAAVAIDAADSEAFGDALAVTGGYGALEREESTRALSVAMGLLAPGDREVLELHHMQGVDVAEMAARLGVEVGAAKMRLVRARRRLGRRLADWGEAVGLELGE